MQLPDVVPVMTLQNATLFPQALLPLFIFEPRYRRMLQHSLDSHRMFAVAMQRPDRVREAPCPVAGLGLIRASVTHDDGTSHLILQGLTRVRLAERVPHRPYRLHRIQALVVDEADNVTIDALVAKVHELVGRRLDLAPFPSPFPEKGPGGDGEAPAPFAKEDVMRYLGNLPAADQVADLVTCALIASPVERQTILETVELESRLKHLIHFLLADVERRQKDDAP